jgi:excisionase family DNA binding protein
MELVRFRSAAKAYRVSIRTVYEWAAAGLINTVDIDGRRFVDLEQSPPPPAGCMSVHDAAKLLGVSRQTIYNRIASGQYGAIEHCGRRLVCIRKI